MNGGRSLKLGFVGKAGKAWKQERVRIIALVRQAKELIDGRVAEETAQGARQRGAA